MGNRINQRFHKLSSLYIPFIFHQSLCEEVDLPGYLIQILLHFLHPHNNDVPVFFEQLTPLAQCLIALPG